jgi:hypothetical protein
MTDDKNPPGGPPPEPPPEDAPPPEGAPGVAGLMDQEIHIVITVKGNQLAVNGPLHDTIFCFGALERAKDVIRSLRDQPQKNPPGETPGGLVIPPRGLRTPRG